MKTSLKNVRKGGKQEKPPGNWEYRNFQIEEDTYRRFKAFCDLQRVSIYLGMQRAMERAIKEGSLR
jgi:hypothetical protein